MTLRGGIQLLGAMVMAALLLTPTGALAQRGKPGGGKTGVKTDLNVKAIAFPTPGVTDFDVGYVEAASLVVSVRPRNNQPGPWELRIQAEAPDMGGYGKSVTDILWRYSGSSTWNSLATTPQAVLQGTGTRDVTIFLRVRLDYAQDVPDSYTADVTFFAETL